MYPTLFIFAVILGAIALGLEKTYPYFSLKISTVIFYTEKVIIDLCVMTFIVGLIELFLVNATNFSLYEYWLLIPHRKQLLAICLLLWILKKYKTFKRSENFSRIRNVRLTAKNPIERLNYLLIIQMQHREINEKNLSLLKSLSPIPIALLVFNNFSEISFENFSIEKFIQSNTLNITLIIILGIYAYKIISISMYLSFDIQLISLIKQEIHLAAHPDIFADKDHPSMELFKNIK